MLNYRVSQLIILLEIALELNKLNLIFDLNRRTGRHLPTRSALCVGK
jgi:hypothetical protein